MTSWHVTRKWKKNKYYIIINLCPLAQKSLLLRSNYTLVCLLVNLGGDLRTLPNENTVFPWSVTFINLITLRPKFPKVSNNLSII